ncbi:hypothetical protein BU15DRAFT_77493 [Melanogaster broomeanus]|nr:hypothetical protein BU15DRAFT_77493 [Melanogaster broomeanus]
MSSKTITTATTSSSISHAGYRALAIYALGGSASLIKDYYEQDGKNQRPAVKSPGPITEENFVEHLGDENFYRGYVTFFSKQIDEKGAAGTLEESIFSEKYNFQDGRDATRQPEMLFRLMDGLLHPMIHVGYGIEFGLKGMLAEGLALARDGGPPLFPRFQREIGCCPILSKIGGVHAFDIIARMLKDDQLKPKGGRDLVFQWKDVLAELGTVIRRYTEMWTVDLREPGEIERKMEELIWVSSVTYGVGGFDAEKEFTPDFYLMHMVTSSLFLPSLIAYLSPRSRVSLLRSYLTSVLTWWVARGRPALNFKSFMAAFPTVPDAPKSKTPPTTETSSILNPFLPIIQSALAHPNDHYAKIQRAFAHSNTLYGLRPAGYFAGTELEGAELLDGSCS